MVLVLDGSCDRRVVCSPSYLTPLSLIHYIELAPLPSILPSLHISRHVAYFFSFDFISDVQKRLELSRNGQKRPEVSAGSWKFRYLSNIITTAPALLNADTDVLDSFQFANLW